FVLVERSLDLERRDVLAAADDHVLEAVDDVEEALLVEDADVARIEPAVAECAPCRLRILPVAREDLRAADDDLAGLAGRHGLSIGIDDPDLRVDDGLADGAQLPPLLALVQERVAADGFREAVGVGEP